MNPIQAASPDDQNVVEFAESPGRRLRVQRQSKGLEIVRIAAQLHLRPAMVEALEHDQYEKLPSPVFVIGYVRNYARLLGLDPEPIVNAYRAGNPNLEPPAPRAARPARSEIGSSHILVRLISLALIAGVIGMLALWWQNRADLLSMSGGGDDAPGLALSPLGEDAGGASDMPSSYPDSGPATIADSLDAAPAYDVPESATAPVAAQDLAPLPAGPGPSADDAEPLPRVAEETDDTAAPALTPVPSVATLDETAAEAPEPAPAEPAGREVALAFSGPCWIDVRDASGKVILTGEMAKGDNRVLEGQPPYSFVIGNATATTLTVGGKPFDLPSRSRGNVARFKLNPEAVD
jgi:cytoskeleton protein RodZ